MNMKNSCIRYKCFRWILSYKLGLSIIICNSTSFFILWILVLNKQFFLQPSITRYSKILKDNIRHNLTKGEFYVLLWEHSDWAPFNFLNTKDIFFKNNCTYQNCYVTDNRYYFGGDLSPFHAIAFNGRVLDKTVPGITRWPHQKFIYFNTESPANIPILNNNYDGFFNWTSTYRLDSDIPYPYIMIKDNLERNVGPKPDMKWKENMIGVDKELNISLLSKSKAAVVFVSNCETKSGREDVIHRLSLSLRAHGYEIDIYGDCGTKHCERKFPLCDKLVEHYFFYLSFENAFSNDYVTEKLLRALRHQAVPIVFGGADYSRFLPPGSYLNARKYSPDDLAAIMVGLIRRPERYRRFFDWRKHYTYHDPTTTDNICALCAALNNKSKYETISEYPNIRKWWNEES